ncbi:MAG: hypothetical protein K9N51_02535 [Candidatus Pacebacteria bacterium]|nr:hypothetical protein [Candidatus Paceibacterota bacterium]
MHYRAHAATVLSLMLVATVPGRGQGGSDAEGQSSIENRVYTSVAVHGGTISSVTVTDKPVRWVDMETVLRKGMFTAGGTDLDAEGDRYPAEGRAYVILTVELDKGMSLGRYDYVLNMHGQTHECLAVTQANSVFDQRTWQVTYEDTGPLVKMLFEVPRPEQAVKATLVPSLSTSLELSNVEITIVPAATSEPAEDEAEPPEAAPEEPAAGPVAGGDEGAGEAPAEEAPAPEEPEVKPVPEKPVEETPEKPAATPEAAPKEEPEKATPPKKEPQPKPAPKKQPPQKKDEGGLDPSLWE